MDMGIRVNAIKPGIFNTPLLARNSQKILDGLNASVPFPKRMGKPEVFASLVMVLVRNSHFYAPVGPPRRCDLHGAPLT